MGVLGGGELVRDAVAMWVLGKSNIRIRAEERSDDKGAAMMWIYEGAIHIYPFTPSPLPISFYSLPLTLTLT